MFEHIRLAVATAALTAVGAMLWSPTAAEAGRDYAVPQAPCDTVGEQRQARNGETYRCEQRRGDDCPVWHWVWRPDKPKGGWAPRSGAPCAKCPPSPSASVSPSGKPSVSASPSPSKPGNAKPSRSTNTHSTSSTAATPGGEDYNNHPGTLPVTGPRAALLAIAGAALVLLGGGALWAGRKPRRRRKPYPPTAPRVDNN